MSHYRFSISWARVLPNGIGQVNQPGVDYYKRLIAALKAANIEPMVNTNFFFFIIFFFYDYLKNKTKKGRWHLFNLFHYLGVKMIFKRKNN